MATEFKLPELGENVESGDIVGILVSEGDFIEKDQTILEIETDKAVIEVPSNRSGVVQSLNVSEGDVVDVGQVILTLDDSGESQPSADTVNETEQGVAQDTTAKTDAPPPPDEPPEAPETPSEEEPAEQIKEPVQPAVGRSESRKLVPAAPSVRRLAREVGVNVEDVKGSGDDGRILAKDVKSYSKMLHAERKAAAGAPISTEPIPDFSKWGEVEREPMSNVRRKTAQHMMSSWAPVPHVTQHDKADITDLESLRKQWAPRVEGTGGKLTVTAILLKVAASALKRFPQFNASIDMNNNEIIYKQYFHIGVAVDTDRGLLVPVIRDVDEKNITELSAELAEKASRARDRKLGLEEMQGGCFSISNLGGIGGTNFTPIVNAPEVAILGVSRAATEPVYQNEEFVPRLMMPLSLSYDHRIIDGAEAARFLRWICEALEEPLLLSLEG